MCRARNSRRHKWTRYVVPFKAYYAFGEWINVIFHWSVWYLLCCSHERSHTMYWNVRDVACATREYISFTICTIVQRSDISCLWIYVSDLKKHVCDNEWRTKLHFYAVHIHLPPKRCRQRTATQKGGDLGRMYWCKLLQGRKDNLRRRRFNWLSSTWSSSANFPIIEYMNLQYTSFFSKRKVTVTKLTFHKHDGWSDNLVVHFCHICVQRLGLFVRTFLLANEGTRASP